MKRFIAFLLIFCNFFQIAVAAFPPKIPNIKNISSQTYSPDQVNIPANYSNNVPIPETLTLTTEQFGLEAPVSAGINYSDLTGAYFSGQYLKKLNDYLGIGVLGEYGSGQYRINGTLGFFLTNQSLFKISAEQLSQRLPFSFDTGNIKKRVNQQALGARFQQFIDSEIFNNLSLGTYIANAPNVGLNPISYISNGINCAGYENGLTCVNERNIAGGRSAGADLGLGLFLTPATYFEGRAYYDSLHYHTIFASNSAFNDSGLGGGLYAHQLLSYNLKISGKAELRKIYDTYDVALSWMPDQPFIRGSELSLMGQRVVTHDNQIPANNIISLQLKMLSDRDSYQAPAYRLDGIPIIKDIRSWLLDPAVKMSQVLAIAEQYTHLAIPNILSISPSSGPITGGNIITISGTNFPAGTTVQIGGKTAQIITLTSNIITVIAPPADHPGIVDTILFIPGLIPIIDKGSYAYNNGASPLISSFFPTIVSTTGGTTITLNGSGLAGATTVTIDGVPVNFTIVSDSQITLIAPPHIAGSAALTVNTGAGSSAPQILTYLAPTATLTSITPTSGMTAGGTLVTIRGSGLNNTNAVIIGGVAAANVQVISDNEVTAITPSHVAGTVSVVVSNGSTNTTLPNAFTYIAPVPNLSGISPTSGSPAGGTAVTLNGSGFTGAITVTAGNSPVSSFTVVNDSEIIAVMPAHAAGSVNVTVTTAGGTSQPQSFNYVIPSPVINSSSPNSGSLAGGTTVSLSGSGFTAATAVNIDGNPVPNFTIVSDSIISFVTPAHAAGTVNITVTTGGGTSNPTTFTYTAAALTLSSVSPNSGPTAGATTVTISGSGFTGSSSVSFGGVLGTNFQVVSDTEISVRTPAHSAGIVNVVVANGGTNATLANSFTYIAAQPVINAGGISPASGPTAGGTTITIHGSGFTAPTAVLIGGKSATNIIVIDDTEITAVTPSNPPGATNVVVITAGGTSQPQPFNYIAPLPVISAVNPASGPTAGGTSIVLSGTGFTNATAVTIDGVTVNFTVVSDTQITAVTNSHVEGTVNVLVTTAGGVSAPKTFTYVAPTPVLSSLSPTFGPTNGGTTLTLNGFGFTGATSVTINGSTITNFTIISDTQISFVTPSHVAGTVGVTVTTAGGTSGSQSFTYDLIALTISSVSPNSGTTAGGTTVTINGSGFTGSPSVNFGSALATNVTVISDSQLTAVSPSHIAGAVDVVISNNNTNFTLTNGFTYQAPLPAISGINPGNGSTTGGTAISISGSGFIGTTAVTVGGIAATNITVVNDNEVIAITPVQSLAGSVFVTVTTAGGTSNPFPFVYDFPPISVSALNPNFGSTSGGTTVLISGAGLAGASSVSFGGITASNFQFINDSQITVVTPAHNAGIVDVVITTRSNSNITLPNAFTYNASLPTINTNGISPNSGSTAGGTLITISGAGFTGTTAVTIGGQPATNFIVVSDSQITATTGPHAAGSVNVTISTSAGTSLPQPFTYTAPLPLISNVNPAFGSPAGGATITITGSGFTAATAVTIGATPATSFTVISDTQITAVTPAHAAGVVGITVTTAGGTSAPINFNYVAASPAVTNISPSSGSTGGGNTVTITGTDLGTITSISFGSSPVSSFTIVSATQITLVAPAHVAGTVDVVLTNGSTNVTVPNAYTYNASLPVIDNNGVLPNSGTTAGGTTITISGSGFTGATAVTIGNLPATSFTVNSDSQITAVTPAHADGTVDVTVTTAGGVSLPSSFNYVAPIPLISTVSPSSGPTAGGTTLIISGSGFTAATDVTIGAVAASSFTIVSDNEVRAVTPVGTAGTVAVTVTTAGGTSNPQNFTYIAPTPIVSGISPNTGSTAGGDTITISGSNLSSVTGVNFGGVAGTNLTIVSDSQITVSSPAHNAGTVDLVLTNGNTNVTVSGAYTYTAPLPVINVNGISPATGPTAGGTTISITGSGFTGASAVTIGGIAAASFTVVSDILITAITPANAAGTVDVTVTTSGGVSLPQSFIYVAPLPVITNISPVSGHISGGTTITLTGTGFTQATAVTIGGTAASSFVVVSDTQITAVTPAHAAGAVNVTVTTAGGVSLPITFTYITPPPIVNSISPLSGLTAGGNLVTINGSGFTGTTSVSFDVTQASSFTVVSDSQITVTAPAHIAGVVDIVVTNGNTNGTLANAYTYIAPFPVINLNGISPSSGSTAGGTSITLTGSGFIGATAVLIDGLPATSFTVVSDTQITAVTPSHADGTVNVTVTTAGGISLPQPFVYIAPIPTLSSISPSSGPISGGTTITLTGSGFIGATAVTIGGIAATSYTVISDGQIIAVTPAHSAGPVNVTVTTAGGVTGVQTFNYLALTLAVTSLNPTFGTTAGGTTVIIIGAGFTGTTGISFGGTAASSFTVDSDSQITVTTPVHVAGLVDLVVSNGSTNVTVTNAFTYIAPLPSIDISGISPATGTTAGGTTITITGSGFIGATAVTIDGIPVNSFTVLSNTQIIAVTPSHVAGSVSVTVTTAGGTSAPRPFVYLAPLPVLSSLNPSSGTIFGGTTVSLTGSGFIGATAVSIGGQPATSFSVISDTQITMVTPAGSSGQVIVTVTTAGGTSAPQIFTYVVPSPRVTSLSPAFGSTAGGNTVNISGSGLTGTTGISFGGTAVSSFTVVSDTQITLTAPSHIAGLVDVVVTNGITNVTATNAYTYIAPVPVININGISPASGTTAGGTTITITGSGFIGTNAVTIGGLPALSYTVISNTQITAVTPAHVAGSVNVSVLTAGGVSLPQPYLYVAPVPIVSNLNPNSGPTLGDTTVIITGSGFIGTTAVNFGSLSAATFTVLSDTQIAAVTPASAPGTVSLSVTTAGGVSSPLPFTFIAPSPSISNLNPNSGSTAGGNTVTINGSGLTGVSGISFGGTPVSSFTVVSDSQITVTTPPHIAGLVDVVVTNGSTNNTAANAFTYIAPLPVISVNGITPTSGPTAGGTILTISGSGFYGATAVTIGGLPATSFTVVSDTQITATTPARAAGTVNVTVTTAGGTSAPRIFSYIAPLPVLSSLNPISGPNYGGTTITMTGSGFIGTTAVSFGGTAASSFTVISDTQLTAVTPARAAGAANVTVTTAGGTSLPQVFTFIAPTPAITNLSPTSGSTAGGNTVTLNGSGLTGVTGVSFGGTAATNLNFVSDSQITVTAPAHIAGIVDIVVTNGNTNVTVTNAYTYIAPLPVINLNGISPSSGPTVGGTSITLSGSGFIGATAVTIDGIPATSFIVNSNTQITAVTPSHVDGSVPVTVTTAGGTSQPQPFVYVAPLPVLTSISPVSGPTAGGTTITLTGSGFIGTTAVTIGGIAAASFIIVSDTQVTAVTPAAAAGAVNVTLTTAGGTTASQTFTYIAPPPSLTSLNPNSGSRAGGTVVTINGTGLTGTTAVNFGGAFGTGIQVVSDSQITVTTPGHSAGTVSVIVTTPGGNATLTNSFTFIQPSLATCHAPLIAVAGAQLVTCDSSTFLSVGVLSRVLVASGTNTSGAQCSNFTQSLLATVGVLGIVTMPTVGVGGLLSPGLIGCSIRLCSNASCNDLGDTSAATVRLGL